MPNIEIEVVGVELLGDESEHGIELSAKSTELQRQIRAPKRVGVGLSKLLTTIAKPLGLGVVVDNRLAFAHAHDRDAVKLICHYDVQPSAQGSLWSCESHYERQINEMLDCAAGLLQESASLGLQQRMHSITCDEAQKDDCDVVYSDRRPAVAFANIVLESGLVGELWVVCGTSRHRLHIPTASRHVAVDPAVERTTSGYWVGIMRAEHAPVAYLQEIGGNKKVYTVMYQVPQYDDLYRAMAKQYKPLYRVTLRLVAAMIQSASRADEQWELIEMQRVITEQGSLEGLGEGHE